MPVMVKLELTLMAPPVSGVRMVTGLAKLIALPIVAVPEPSALPMIMLPNPDNLFRLFWVTSKLAVPPVPPMSMSMEAVGGCMIIVELLPLNVPRKSTSLAVTVKSPPWFMFTVLERVTLPEEVILPPFPMFRRESIDISPVPVSSEPRLTVVAAWSNFKVPLAPKLMPPLMLALPVNWNVTLPPPVLISPLLVKSTAEEFPDTSIFLTVKSPPFVVTVPTKIGNAGCFLFTVKMIDPCSVTRCPKLKE